MIYKSPAPNLKHEIFASTPFSKYIKLVHALVKGPKKMLPQTQIFFLGPNANVYLDLVQGLRKSLWTGCNQNISKSAISYERWLSLRNSG